MADTIPDQSAPSDRQLRGATQHGMRARNERLVLTLIRRHGALAKAEIARMTGLSAQTVSVIMRQLEADGLLIKCEPVRGKVGQPSVPMRLNPEGAYFFGLKVGRRRTELALVDFLGQPVHEDVTWHDYPTPDDTIAFALRAIRAQMDRMDAVRQDRIAGLGIGLPFRLWEWASALGVPQDAMADWQGRDLQADLAPHLPWPVELENDASAACNAELVFGTQELPANFLHAFLGFFAGGGLVLNGALYKGHTGNAGALASVPVPTRGGTVVQLAAIASLHQLELRHDRPIRIWESTTDWDADPALVDAWTRDAAHALAHATAAAVALCDLDAVVIDGWLAPPLKRRLVARTADALDDMRLAGMRRPSFLEGTAGPSARSLGAASLILSSRFLADPATD